MLGSQPQLAQIPAFCCCCCCFGHLLCVAFVPPHQQQQRKEVPRWLVVAKHALPFFFSFSSHTNCRILEMSPTKHLFRFPKKESQHQEQEQEEQKARTHPSHSHSHSLTHSLTHTPRPSHSTFFLSHISRLMSKAAPRLTQCSGVKSPLLRSTAITNDHADAPPSPARFG